jgi:hypothetical protein
MRIVGFALGASKVFAPKISTATKVLLASVAKHALELVGLANIQRDCYCGWEPTCIVVEAIKPRVDPFVVLDHFQTKTGIVITLHKRQFLYHEVNVAVCVAPKHGL